MDKNESQNETMSLARPVVPISHSEFFSLCEVVMCSEFKAEKGQRAQLYLQRAAKAFGYEDWIAAYHASGSQATPGAEPETVIPVTATMPRRDLAILIAQHTAAHPILRPTYYAEGFIPHEWVVLAIMMALDQEALHNFIPYAVTKDLHGMDNVTRAAFNSEPWPYYPVREELLSRTGPQADIKDPYAEARAAENAAKNLAVTELVMGMDLAKGPDTTAFAVLAVNDWVPETETPPPAVDFQPMDNAPQDGRIIRLRIGKDEPETIGWWLGAKYPFPWAFVEKADGQYRVNRMMQGEFGPTAWAPYELASGFDMSPEPAMEMNEAESPDTDPSVCPDGKSPPPQTGEDVDGPTCEPNYPLADPPFPIAAESAPHPLLAKIDRWVTSEAKKRTHHRIAIVQEQADQLGWNMSPDLDGDGNPTEHDFDATYRTNNSFAREFAIGTRKELEKLRPGLLQSITDDLYQEIAERVCELQDVYGALGKVAWLRHTTSIHGHDVVLAGNPNGAQATDGGCNPHYNPNRS